MSLSDQEAVLPVDDTKNNPFSLHCARLSVSLQVHILRFPPVDKDT